MGNDELDKILDSALASYSQEEPRPGLDGRVLNHIRAAGEVRRFAWLRWAMAIPALVCLLVLALTFWSKRDLIPRPPKPIPTVAKGLPVLPVAPQITQLAITRPTPKRLPKRLPKREQFPTPTPLTAEERALLAFVAHSPKQAEQALAAMKSRSVEPIQIAEIHIKPLQDGR
jgi:hypothetical protein